MTTRYPKTDPELVGSADTRGAKLPTRSLRSTHPEISKPPCARRVPRVEAVPVPGCECGCPGGGCDTDMGGFAGAQQMGTLV